MQVRHLLDISAVKLQAFNLVVMALFTALACESRPESATPDEVRMDAGVGANEPAVSDEAPPPGWPADAGPAEVTAPPIDPTKESPLPADTPPERMP